MDAGICASSGDRKRGIMRKIAPFLGLAIVILVFALLSGSPARYLSVANLRIVLAQTVIVAIGAIGMTMIIVSGGIDLSVGSVIALTSVITAQALAHHWSPVSAMFGGVGGGGLAGVVNGVAIASLPVVPFIATLGMLGIARGAAKWVAGEMTVAAPPSWINELAVTFPSANWMIVAPGVWLALLLAIAAAVVLRNTVFGRRV